MLYFNIKQKNIIHFYAFLAILLLLYFYILSPLKILDYDSVHNFQILEEMHQGNWHNLFHHGSPVFYIFYFPVYLAFKDIDIFLIINLLINIFSVYFFARILKQALGFYLAWLTSSLFIFTSSYYFSIESLSLLSSSILWFQVCIFLENPYSHKIFKKAFFIGIWCGITLLINYKFIVVLPFMVVGLWTVKNDFCLSNTLFFKVIYYTFIGFITPVIFLMIVGSILGLRWYQYQATLYSIFSMSGKPNPTSLELGYYFFYFLKFENILIAFLVFFRLIILRNTPFQVLEKFMIVVILGVFTVMSFLPKAPRGLVFIIPLIYVWSGLSFEILRKKIFISDSRKWLGSSLVFLSVLIQAYRMYDNLYLYKQTSYPKVAQYLKEQNSTVVFTTLGMGVYPYLDKSVKLEVLRNISDTVKFQQFKGKKYLLYDAFCETAGHTSLHILKQKKAILRYPEKSLLVPTLFLEHSEYTGFSFKKSLELQKNMQKEEYQLLLIPLP